MEILRFCVPLQSGFYALPWWFFACEGKRGFIEVVTIALIGIFSIGAVFPTYAFLSSSPGNGLSDPGSNSLRRSCCGHMGDFQREVLEMG